MAWTLATGSTEKTFESWSFGKVKRRRVSQQIDTCTFTHFQSESLNASPVIPIFSQCKIWMNRAVDLSGHFTGGTIFFQGLITEIGASGDGGSQSTNYTLSGPWWYLTNKVYKQVWKAWFSAVHAANGSTNPTPTGTQGVDWVIDNDNYFILIKTSHLVLNQRIPDPTVTLYNKSSTGQQIRDAIQFAIDEGAPIQIGDEFPDPNWTIDQAIASNTGCPNFDVPLSVEQEVVCSDVIKKMLRWSPDAPIWFDYTTVPPTVHCLQRPFLSASSIPYDTNTISSLSLTPRYDLQPPCVFIFFELPGDGGTGRFMQTITESQPDDLPPVNERFGAYEGTISLQGPTFSSENATVNVTPIDLNNIDFWKLFVPYIGTLTFPQVVVGSAQRGDGSHLYPNVLLPTSGPIASWMSVHSELETISVDIKFTLPSGTSVPAHRITHNFIATDAVSKLYSDVKIDSLGEPKPKNLVQAIWDAVKTLHYSGSTVLDNQEPAIFDIGTVLNILSGKTEWETMRAMIVSVTEDIDEGRTTIEFGPPAYLGQSDLMELLRTTRERKIGGPIFWRPGAQLDNGMQVNVGNTTPRENSTALTTWKDVDVTHASKDPDNPDAGKEGLIKHDAKNKLSVWSGAENEGVIVAKVHVTEEGSNKGKDVKFVEYDVCVKDPVTGGTQFKKALFWATKPY
jgi:hypothetical protein